MTTTSSSMRTGVRTNSPQTPLKDNNNDKVLYIYNNIYNLDLIKQCFRVQFGYAPFPAVLDTIAGYLETVEPSLICAVIEYTVQTAPRPSWAYANAVIKRQIAAGSKTAEDFSAACDAFRASSGSTVEYKPGYYRRRNSQQDYQQRDYDDSVNDMSAEDLAEAARL